VAGGGVLAPAEGVLATDATIFAVAVAVDRDENIYFALPTPDSQVFRFRQGGALELVAGTGAPGFNGDGIAARAAQLDDPQGLALDSAGNLFIADTQNDRVRRVDRVSGIITTVAGTGETASGPDRVPATQSRLNGPVGLAIDAHDTIYVGELYGNRVRRFRVFP
jgi:sugar lactone lactonase YvrE